MAQDLNNPTPMTKNTGNGPEPLTGDEGQAVEHDPYTTLANWAKGAWQTFSGRNDYRAPENVFNPLAKYSTDLSFQNRGNQLDVYNRLNQPNAYYQGLMRGTNPSLAEYQMRQGIAQANRAGMMNAAGANGVNRAAAFRAAQNNASNLAAQQAIAGGQQRLQEQQLGAQGYSQGLQAQGNLAGTTRQQDIGEQQGLFGLQNQAQSNLNQQYQINAGITNQNATNQQRAGGGIMQAAGALLASDIRAKEDIKPGTTEHGTFAPYQGPDPNAMSRAMAPGVISTAPAASSPLAQALSSYGNSMQGGGNNGGAMFNAQDSANFAKITSGDSGGGGAPGGGSIPGMDMLSDEDSKEAFRGVHPYEFRYKDAFADEMGKQAAGQAYQRAVIDAKTPRTGVMAQDMAKNPVAKDAVTTMPDGMLGIDGKRAMGLVLATQADLNDRLSALEKRKAIR